MVYILSMIVTIVAALLILTTRYEVNTVGIQNELAQLKVMFTKIDNSVDDYMEAGGNLNNINFQVLNAGHYLLSNSLIYGTSFASTMKFNGSAIIWQIIPNMTDSTSFKLMIDLRGDKTLMEKASFSEMFIGTEYCEKLLFGNFNTLINTYDGVNIDFISVNGSNNDGIIGCTVFK